MNKTPLVSVIMNCYNSETYLREAIESVLNQSYPHLEIIFWDNQSTDESAKIVQSYKDKRIKYFYAKNHTSLGEGRNYALKECTGEYIAFLDCDDRWVTNKLFLQLSILRENPKIFFCFGSYVRYFQISKREVVIRPCSKKIYTFTDIFRHYPINLQTVLFNTQILKSVDHYFDNRLSFSEEYDFFLRLLHENDAICISEPLAMYRIHNNQITNRHFEKASLENEIILDKLLALYPELSTSYGVTYFKGKTAYFRAKFLMQSNEKEEARSVLSPYKFLSPAFFLLYTLSFSKTAWNIADKLKSRG
ncbi:MAG TPA: glycosyltransferase [Sulfuricurvum sp.]|nr:MAG: hypothetical protein B7Y30_08395 [Campylobacterales bacterium 16-40-21]OZA02291.1 MAG: hypothetical protein B7X89_09700 [Sulfuricurvum sp. 17-40-25]HQS67300.1 glycosyltransferase [Sulfuricurvum sp.]HQT36680.1 glycosyltransferase [Sulfuricurvum sp.]